MSKHTLKDVFYAFVLIFSSLLIAQNNSSRALSQINNSLAGQNMRIDSLDAQMRLLLPELQNALSANLKAKEQTDSVAILLQSSLSGSQFRKTIK